MAGATGTGVQQATMEACANPSENGRAAKENARQADGGLPSTGVQALSERPPQPL